MGVFLYYIPGIARQDVTRGLLRERGLATAFADILNDRAPIESRLTVREVHNAGPDKGRGVLLCPTPVEAAGWSQRVGHYPDAQEWEAVEAEGMQSPAYWLGLDCDDPPTPEALRRPEVVDGYEHVLGDKRAWLCPIIRRCIITPMVPRAYRRRGSELVGEVVAEYRAIWEASARWAAAAFSDEAPALEEWFDGAVDCLALNYRLGVEEIGRLGLLNDQTIRLVIEAAIDEPWLAEALEDPEKKSDVERVIHALRNFSPGAGDSSPDTPPAEAS